MLTYAVGTGTASFACNCLKNCAHYTGKDELKKYRCTGGAAVKVRAIVGTPASTKVQQYKSTNTGAVAGTKAQILTLPALSGGYDCGDSCGKR